VLDYYSFRSKRQINLTHTLLYTNFNKKIVLFTLFDKKEGSFFMKKTEMNKEKWIEKVKYTMELGGKSEKTYNNYKSHIIRFLNYYDGSVEINKLPEDKIVEYFRKQYVDLNKCAETLNLGICSIKYLYSVCFNRQLNKDILPSTKLKKKIPTIISKKLFLKIFNEESCIKYKCWLVLAFCSRLRVEEIARIRIEDIYPNEHKIKVLGKGNKERYTILPDIVTKYLRMYCKEKHIANKRGYLFSSHDKKLILILKVLLIILLH